MRLARQHDGLGAIRRRRPQRLREREQQLGVIVGVDDRAVRDDRLATAKRGQRLARAPIRQQRPADVAATGCAQAG